MKKVQLLYSWIEPQLLHKSQLSVQETRKRVKHVKKEPLTESQLFIMELARELNRICQVRQIYGCIVPVLGFSPALQSVIEYISTHVQTLCISAGSSYADVFQRSDILAHIWTGEDVWPPHACREFIVETANILEMKVRA